MSNLTKEQKILLEIVKSGITGSELKIPEGKINWEEVILESKVQAVTILACDSAAAVKEAIPKDLFQKWQNSALMGTMSNLKVQKAQRDMVSIMEEAKSPYVILKGLAAASYYPKPELRTLGDVDFLILPEQKEELSDLFTSKGYEKSLETHICHIVLRKPGAHLEMHFEPSGIPNSEKGKKVREFFKDAALKSEEVSLEKDVFTVPKPFYHGMVLALHTQHHQVSEGLGLRHLCDWACFVEKTAGEAFWNELLEEFRVIGLFRYVQIITKTCSTYLGTKLPDWAKEADDEICEEIIEDIFAGGNFGRKNEKRSKSGIMISNHGKDGTDKNIAFYLYKTLHAASLAEDPSVDKNKLKWFWLDTKKAFRYIAKTKRGERTSLIKLVPDAKKRKAVYEKLHLFETEN